MTDRISTASPVQRFLGSTLMAAGGLMATPRGLCSLGFLGLTLPVSAMRN